MVLDKGHCYVIVNGFFLPFAVIETNDFFFHKINDEIFNIPHKTNAFVYIQIKY